MPGRASKYPKDRRKKEEKIGYGKYCLEWVDYTYQPSVLPSIALPSDFRPSAFRLSSSLPPLLSSSLPFSAVGVQNGDGGGRGMYKVYRCVCVQAYRRTGVLSSSSPHSSLMCCLLLSRRLLLSRHRFDRLERKRISSKKNRKNCLSINQSVYEFHEQEVLEIHTEREVWKPHSHVNSSSKTSAAALFLGGAKASPPDPPPQIPYINALFPIFHFSRLVVS